MELGRAHRLDRRLVMAFTVGAASLTLAGGLAQSALADEVTPQSPLHGGRATTSPAEREAAKAASREEREEERLDGREAHEREKELRVACRAHVAKERDAFEARQARRAARFGKAQAAKRAKFYAVKHTRTERDAFHAKLSKRAEQFRARQQRRREAFHLRAVRSEERCGAIGDPMAAPLAAANIYLGTVGEEEDLGGEEILSPEI